MLVPQLRRLRIEAMLSQDELADRAGVARTTVMRGELGLELRYASVRKLASALKTKPATLTRHN